MRATSLDNRAAFSEALGISPHWATAEQVHGAEVIQVVSAASGGPADALFTARPGLPVAVLTADCAAVVVHASTAVGIAHAGWRGAAGGVVRRLVEAMAEDGHAPSAVSVGPAIGSCCYEVGRDVLDALPGHHSTTSWGTPSVDLVGAVLDQVAVSDRWAADVCTRCGEGFYSHRGSGTPARMAGVGWLL
jgi:YfiH family protein